jgi:serine/threonine-protein kinase PpkA
MASSSIQITGYEVLRPLGSGGMSTVYLALQRSLDRKVAIKVMRRMGDAASPDAAQAEKRFLLEGRMMAKLPHRNIVAVYDIVSNEDMSYISMEYLDGGTLAERMKTGLSLAEAVSVVVQIGSALDFAHTHGVVHRDLKPANIMFRDGATPVLTDFGIARYQDGTATRLTQTGMLVGTPTYMSPEQINGNPVDGRADLYSLGILFYELLAGVAPFRGDTPIAVLMAHLTQPPPALPDEFKGFQSVMDRMIAKNRDERYATLKEFTDDLKSRLVHSDTLLTRLHIDPAQTSSEQLRALGFATSSPTGERLRDSLLSNLSASGPRPISFPPHPVPAPPRPIPWTWITAALGVILLGIGAFIFLRGHGSLSKDEQELVGFWLDRAQQRIEANQLVTPADDSAFSYLQKALQKDGENARAQTLLANIAKTLAEQAQQALAAGKLDAAADLNNQALLMAPDDAGLRTLATQIAQSKKADALKGQVRTLVEHADAAREVGRVFGEGAAYPLLIQAQTLVPNDADVRKRIDAIIAAQLDAPRKALEAGDASGAIEQLAKLQAYLGTTPTFTALRADADAAVKKQQAEKSIVELIARGNAQLKASHLAEPGGDNAYETLGELSKIAGDDKRAAEFAAGLAKALLADARALDRGGQPARALERAGLALQVAPSLADAQVLKQQIEGRLGERAAKLAQTLSAARQAIAEQRFVPPATNDAHAALQAVLAIDANNADAKQLLAELPKRVAEAATARARSDVGAAVAMVNAARAVFAQDAALATLAAKLDAQSGAEKAAALAQASRERIEKTLAGAASVEQLRAAVQDLDSLLASNAADKDALALRTRLIDAVGGAARASAGAADFDALATLLKDQSKTLGGDPAYTKLIAELPDARIKIAAAEQARLDAERGELVLNAYPWGKVESVLDANRQPVKLPDDATTPVTLKLPAGSYKVTFAHPQSRKPVQVIAKVEAQKRALANAAFTTISATEYFSRAGW